MTKVTAGITTSLDGYVTGPNDGPGCGLGEGGERLHYWVALRWVRLQGRLEPINVLQSPFATHITYRVR